MKLDLKEKIEEIVEFARKNNDSISESTVIDIIKNKEELVHESQISEVKQELEKYGISIVTDEGYPAEETDPETFIPAEVNISQKPLNIYNLMERLLNDEIELQPGFQRKGNLWSLKKQSQLIESLMLKIPIPAFYFNAKDDDKWVVIDGLQRLSAFENFLVGVENDEGERIKKKFEGLQYLKDFNGFTFDDLPRQYIRRIKETSVIAYTVEKGTPEEVVFNIFQRINTGGIVLNDQEIRQALYQGTGTKLLQRMADCEEFGRATQYMISKDRMIDREYANRFLAFTELDYRKEYAGNIDSFLIKALKQANTYHTEKIESIENDFKRIMRSCYEIFGKYAFRKYNEKMRRGPINKAIFEIWSVCFSELTEEQLECLKGQKEEFIARFGKLLLDKEFALALKAGDRYSTVRRIEMARNMVKEFL